MDDASCALAAPAGGPASDVEPVSAPVGSASLGLSDEGELFRRAYYDDLTGLPNRSHLRHAVDVLVEQGDGGFALAFMDLDGFKGINDYYGHPVGDQILATVAQRLTAMLPNGGLLSRIGGDEFVLVLRGREDPLTIVKSMLARLRQPIFADGHEVFASASVGISLFPDHGRDFEALRRNADLAMYRVKGECKGAVALFDDAMRSAADRRMEVEQRLRLAIRDRRFLCAYQPKVDIRTHRTVGLEVLLRWRDEAGFIQPPGDFLSLAIELGMINDITRTVVEETVAAIDHIDDTFGQGTTISFNVAPKQAGDVDFMKDLIGDLEATGLSERFMIEVTEEAFFARSEFQKTVLPMLRGIGTKLSIDDFGVGYSSLAALADLTADELKVDRSFITDIHRRPRSQVILKAIESLGHSLGMNIVAEGVESFEELAFLGTSTAIRQAQGYYFSKPMLLETFSSTRLVSCRSRSHATTRNLISSRTMLRRAAP